MGKIFVVFLLIVSLIGIYAWLSGGALEKIRAQADEEGNPVKHYFIRQLGETVVVSPDILAPATPAVSAEERSSSATTRDIEEAKQFGDPSPLRGTIVFEQIYRASYQNTAADNEFLVIRASNSNKESISLSGWSVQSAVSGARAFIGEGIRVYRMNENLTLSPIELSPGASATIVSGRSPLGASFRLNVCSGYLEQFQDFAPNLPLSCPTPSEELPNTLENLRTYGASCIDFVKTLPSCTYHLGGFPEGLSPECRGFISGGLSYNNCVARHQYDSDFSGGAWRIYLGNTRELWNNAHDVIRLLDDTGRTVDVFVY